MNSDAMKSETKSFEDLGLAESVLRAIRNEGYETATPIQAQAIPTVLEGRDLMGCAQTGTGKTAAFALPTLHRLAEGNRRPGNSSTQPGRSSGKKANERRSQRNARPIRTLVLAPTRELAVQVAASFNKYGKFTGLRTTTVYGGVNQNPQVRALRNGVDILVATPGRLLDLMNQGHVDLKQVQILILDEADQMLDMGFLPDLRKIVAKTPERRQTLMFSATMPAEIRRLASRWLKEPEHVQVAALSSPVEAVEQSVYFVHPRHKPQMLTHYLENSGCGRTLVFVRTKHGADKIVKHLNRSGIRAAAIHGNKSQNARTRTLQQFKSQQPPVLIATDVAARGLDVDSISHVINYELPEVPEIYVHRIGRTGRAGASGIATSFCGGDERSQLKRIERLMRRSIEAAQVPTEYKLPPEPVASSSAGGSRRPKPTGNARPGKKRPAGKSSRGGQKPGAQAGARQTGGSKRRRRRPTASK